MNVEFEDVFTVRDLGHFAFLRTTTLADKEEIGDGRAAELDGHPVTVADIAPRALDVYGAPRLDVFVVKFDKLVNIDEWKARRGTILAFDLSKVV